MAKHVFFAFTNPVPGREDDFNDWQNNVHLPHGLNHPDFVRAKRYKLSPTQFVPAEGREQYVTIWEIESDDLAATIAKSIEADKTAVYTDAIDFPTIRTAIYTEVKPD